MNRKVKRFPLSPFLDERGSLLALEETNEVPFQIRRVYSLSGSDEAIPRGFHAHCDLEQLLVCIRGGCKMVLDDGYVRKEYELKSLDTGLLVSGLIWREIYDLTDNDVLLVLASQLYDESDYVRHYEEFTRLALEFEGVDFG